jgi:hypothetical protein
MQSWVDAVVAHVASGSKVIRLLGTRSVKFWPPASNVILELIHEKAIPPGGMPDALKFALNQMCRPAGIGVLLNSELIVPRAAWNAPGGLNRRLTLRHGGSEISQRTSCC